MSELQEYSERFSCAVVSRSAEGVLTIRLHTDGEALRWGTVPHRELPQLFAAIAADRDNRVVILTGTGESFITWPEDAGRALVEGTASASHWDGLLFEGRRLIMNLLDIDVPIIAAVNGPATAHSEIAVLADVVLASDTVVFRDQPHFTKGLVPGDGMQVVWPMLLGVNRGRAFLLTGQSIGAEESRALGVVAEVLSPDQLMPRASAVANDLAGRNPTLLRYTRYLFTHALKRAMHDELELGIALESLSSLSNRDWVRASPGAPP